MPLPKWGGRDAHTSTELAHLGSKSAQEHAEDWDSRHHEYGINTERSSSSNRCWQYLQHQGGWLLASAHIVTAIIGAGVLGLPHAMSWLGWVGGVIVLVLFFAITLWCSLLLADMYEVDGVKHPTYRAAVLHVLGPWNAAAVVVFQYLNLILSSIGYVVAAGSSIQVISTGGCNRSQPGNTCEQGAWRWSLLFGVLQLFFSQLPNLESAWWSSIVGATMSVLYSSCALGLSASKASNNYGSIYGRAAPPAEKAYGIFNALGSVAFAYNFSAVLLEIQDTLHEPPKATQSMPKAVTAGLSVSFVFYMLVSITGYLALGDAVPGDILTGFEGPYAVVMAANIMVLVHMISAYQVFSQPVFHGWEELVAKCMPCWRRRPAWLLRLFVRSFYVVGTTTVACLMPFFTDIIGLVGALVFFPAAVYFPVEMYIKVRRPRVSVRHLLRVMSVATAVVSVLAAVGAVQQIIRDVDQFHIGGKRHL